MSKKLNKLVDINGLREFKSKLNSAYVQTGAVNQTIGGTKTFSKPIVGSLTGNAATATQFSANATVALTGDATGTSAGSKKGWSVPVTLANSGVTAGTYGPSADVTGNNNATISVPEITVDVKGRVTSVTNRTLTCKNNTYNVYNKTLTIQKNGTNVATFTSNSNTDVTANITVPTKVSELTNDSGFLTSHQSLSNYVTLDGAQTISGAKTFTGDIIGINKERSTEDANSLYSTTAGSKLTYYTTSNGGTTLTNVPAAVNTTLESRTIRRLSDSDWIVEQICHNSNGLYYRKGSNGTWGAWKTFAFTDSNISGNAATATKLQTARTINGTSFNGTANITTANWGTARNISITDGTNTSTAVSVNGSANVSLNLPSTIKATFVGNITGNVTGDVTGNCSGSSGSCTGNAATATKLAAARTINGTAFNGTANITTANWGTARNISIADATATNTGEAVSVNGSAAVTLKLPAAIKANVTGSLSGNAATATKLATARTIALSGAATGTATGFDGSGNITIPVTALASSAIKSAINVYDLVPDGAANHRNFYRGKDITAAFNAGTVSANIANGSFKDIFPGDYITKQITVPRILKADGKTEYIAQKTYTVKFVIADLDVWLNRGDTATTVHHVAIVPQSAVFNSVMNETNVTDGGYLGSFMRTHVMPAFATGLRGAFGEDHILSFRFFDTNAINKELQSGGIVGSTGATYWGGREWTSHYCHLMLETMLYGAPITASCAADELMGGVQFAAFRLNSNLVYNRQNYWLSDVVSSGVFARVVGAGSVGADSASNVIGVRPFALLV